MKETSKIRKLVGLALFTAIVVVLQLLAGTIAFGPFSPSFVLIPIVVGAAIYGIGAGAYLGFVFGVVVLIACITGADKGGYILWSASPIRNILVVVVRCTLAGLAAGAVCAAFGEKHRTVGSVVAAIVCPIANTGLFCAGMFLLFRDILTEWAGGSSIIYYIIFGMVGINFLIEMGINVVLSPVIVRIIRARSKRL